MNIQFSRTSGKIVRDFFQSEEGCRHQNYSWGNTLLISEGVSYAIREYIIIPGEQITSHYHMESSEHWTMLRGCVILCIEEQKLYLGTGETCVIQPGEYHSFKNVSLYPAHAIMIQSGGNLSREDSYPNRR